MKVKEYRDLISHVERIVNVDYYACVDGKEKKEWAERAARIGSDLINSECPRASEELRERAARIIDKSADRIIGVVQGESEGV